MKHSFNVVLLGTVLTILWTAVAQGDPGAASLSERLESSRLESVFGQEPVYLVKFDAPVDATVSLEGVPAARALLHAANYYALYARDFEVTPAEIVHAGLWPFETVPSELMDKPLRVSSRIHFHAEELATIDTPGWLVNAKARILDQFYRDYYTQMPREQHALLAPEELTAIPGFWVNNLTGEPMTESANEGDVSLWDLQTAFGEDAGVTFGSNTSDPAHEWTVSRINRTDAGQTARPIEFLTPENSEHVTLTD